jgi:hypothetical protein
MRSPLSLRVVTRCGSSNSSSVIPHTGGETPRIVTLRVAARGLFFFFVNAIKNYKNRICSQKSIRYYPQSVSERPHRVKNNSLAFFLEKSIKHYPQSVSERPHRVKKPSQMSLFEALEAILESKPFPNDIQNR